MKKSVLFAGCLFGVAMLHGQIGEYEIKRTFVSPNDSVTAAVAAQMSALGRGHPPIYSLGVASNGLFMPFAQLPDSRYFREYHGTGWFDGEPRWIDDRFLIFEDDAGIAIAEVQSRRLLVDHVFTDYEKSPVADKWVAIRLRAVGRLQPQLTDDFEDTVLMIDPYDVANQIDNATEDNFVGQMKVAHPGGIILAKCEWAPDGLGVAVLVWERGNVKAVRYDVNLNETARVPVNLQVDHESALSLSLNPNLSETARRILSDAKTFKSTTAVPSP